MTADRFTIRKPDGTEEVQPLPSDGAVLSKAINWALHGERSHVTWEVIEWDEVIYTVSRDGERNVLITTR